MGGIRHCANHALPGEHAGDQRVDSGGSDADRPRRVQSRLRERPRAGTRVPGRTRAVDKPARTPRQRHGHVERLRPTAHWVRGRESRRHTAGPGPLARRADAQRREHRQHADARALRRAEGANRPQRCRPLGPVVKLRPRARVKVSYDAIAAPDRAAPVAVRMRMSR